MQNQKKVQKCAEALQSAFPRSFRPALGIVLGTGMGDLADSLDGAVRIPCSELPGFPKSTVPSHKGFFVAGYAGGSKAGGGRAGDRPAGAKPSV